MSSVKHGWRILLGGAVAAAVISLLLYPWIGVYVGSVVFGVGIFCGTLIGREQP